MTAVKPGDVVLVSFPFTDLSQNKVRPAVVISTEEVHKKEDDYTLLFISSVVSLPLEPYEVLLNKGHPDFRQSGLKKDSVLKGNKIATLRKSLLKRQIGSLGPGIQSTLRQALRKALFLDD